MKQSEVKELSTAELSERVFEEKRELNRIKMAHAITPLDNPMELRAKRKTIARLNGEISLRQREELSNN
jgi:large subunit ribosomal protein L29